MIEQKDFINLIHKWGYNPKSLEIELLRLREAARKTKDVVGMVAYTTLLTMCRYASTNDPVSSVQEREIEPALIELLDEEMADAITNNKEEFSENVLETAYGHVKDCLDLFSATLIIRENVLLTVAPLVVKAHVMTGGEITDKLMECFIGAEEAYRSGVSNVKNAVARSSVALEDFVKELKLYSPQLEACQNTDSEDINAISVAVCGDVKELFSGISDNMLSIIDKPPREWIRYSVSFGRVMTAYMLAVSLGYISYDDLDSAVRKFKVILNDSEKKNDVKFGRN